MTSRPGPPGDLPPIRFVELARALLEQADRLVPMWLPGGARRGHEWVCGSLSGGKGSSCSVNLTNGRWADFAADESGGDLLDLYAAIHGLQMAQAALQVARETGLEDVAGIVRGAVGGAPPPPRPAPSPPKEKPARERDSWESVTPVPESAPAATFKHHYRQVEDITYTATYRLDGALLGYVVRFRTSDGGKDVVPYTWCRSARDGAMRWHWLQFGEPRPLYLPAGNSPARHAELHGGALPTVVLVEGEKKADALQQLLDAGAPGVYLVASWPGGCNAWAKADWSLLAGCTALLWPDCDAKRKKLTAAERKACADDVAIRALQLGKPLLPADKQPGMAAMRGIGAHLRDGHGCNVQLLPIPEPGAVADGWDCDDAINADGWDFAAVAAFFARAYALPSDASDQGRTGAPGADAGSSGDGAKIDGLAGAEGGDGQKINGHWIPLWLLPYYDADKGRWLVSRKLVIKALENDPALCDVLAYDELANTITARVCWPWLHAKPGPMGASDDLLLGDYLTRTYGLPSIARAALVEAIETVANARRVHPVREYLAGLEWDKTRRIDRWLIHAIGETPETLLPVVAEYLALVGRFWLLGMVNRVMEPGCKFDYCPVLEGPGGLGKSTLVEALASPAWFSDTHFDVARGKEGQEQIQGLWLYEIAELANFGKAEISLIKAFITAKVDRYRAAYARVVEAYPRQAVLVGTTNESTYLRDRTGNRRFWPIPVRQQIRIGWVRKVRDQLFAEAYALYLQGTAYTPAWDVEKRLFEPMQESRLVETAVLSELLAVLTREPAAAGIGAVVNELTEFVTISQLTQALGVDAAKSNAALEAQIRGWMDHEGWQRVKRQINGARAWGYQRPRDWPAPEPAAEPSPAAAPATVNSDGGADDAPF